MAIRIVFCLISLIVATSRADECPGAKGDDWVVGTNRCYCYVDQAKTWKEAQKHCSTLGFAGALAFLNNPRASYEARSAVENGGAIPDWLWIGVTDEGHENVWMSVDGVEVQQLGFRPGQPDNAGGHEHYVHINGDTWEWNDIPGSNEYPFICQVEPAVRDEVRCPQHWRKHGNLCYKYIDSQMNWYDAQERCSIMGNEGSLAFVGCAEDNDNVFESAGTDGDFWIGLTDLCHEGQWSSAYGKVTQFVNWRPSEPNDLSGEDCVHITKVNREWNDLSCGNNERPFVCQMSAAFSTRRCPEGWIERGDSCYRYFRESGTWEEASKKCRRQGQGGNLPFIASDKENNEVYEAAAMSAGGECVDNFKNFWIGITDHEVAGAWTGPDGLGRIGSYSAWAAGEPNDGGLFGEGYVEMLVGTKLWNDEDGDEDAFVCRLPAEPDMPECICPECPIPEPCPLCPECPIVDCPEPPPCPDCPLCPVPEPCPDPACPEMWTAHNGFCYLYNGERVSWDVAKTRCVELQPGAFLVSHQVRDDEVRQFLGDYIAIVSGAGNSKNKKLTYAWTGLDDIEEEGVFRGHDNEVFEGEVNQMGRRKKNDCVSVQKGELRHDRCDKKRAFVCMMPQNMEVIAR